MGSAAPQDNAEVAAPIPLTEPREGLPPVVTEPRQLHAVVAAFAAAHGPCAVDVERASGYRYGQRAYLVQLRREGAGTALVDPVACPDLHELAAALADAEWVIHAANQDLPSLTELGMRPRRLFDTELAGRLAGFPRVGLGPLVERLLGHALEKGHAAVDWSRRPLPEPWLHYAALDVELLIELRDALEAALRAQGKLEWAHQEFAAVLAAGPPAPRSEPWRRTSGIHRVRGRRNLAVVRALWEARDAVARRRDLAPGRVLPDAAIVAAAIHPPTDVEAFLAIPGAGRAGRRQLTGFVRVVQQATRLPEHELPPPSVRSDGPPPPNRWADRDPGAAARLARARESLGALAHEHSLPVENLLAPDVVRRLAWEPPRPADAESVADTLRGAGARDWQVALCAAPLAAALRAG